MLTNDNYRMIVLKIAERIEELKKEKEYLLVALDGRCGAGKTTLADLLKESIACNVIHTDSFFLRPEQRTEERLQSPGGNVDYERILEEVIKPWHKNKTFSYRPFSCTTKMLEESVMVLPQPVTLIEGAYSCHPSLIDNYDLKIFLDIDTETQRKRVQERNGENASMFYEKWIPMEEKYLKEFSVKENCDMYF